MIFNHSDFITLDYFIVSYRYQQKFESTKKEIENINKKFEEKIMQLESMNQVITCISQRCQLI